MVDAVAVMIDLQKQEGLKGYAFAKKLGITPQHLSRIKKHRSPLSPALRLKLANMYLPKASIFLSSGV